MAKELRYELTDEQLESVIGGQILFIDRIEGDYVIAADKNGHTVVLERKLLPKNICEGDVVSCDDNKYTILDDPRKRQGIEKLQDELFGE